jgi:hypothetical protein
MTAGTGLHIVVNANAKRGGRRIAVQIARALPGANVRLTRSIEEVEAWLRTVKNPRCIGHSMCKRPDLIEGRRKGHKAVPGYPSICRLEPDDTAE